LQSLVITEYYHVFHKVHADHRGIASNPVCRQARLC